MVMWKHEIEENRFLIEEMVTRICFGSPGSIREWIRWGSYKTAEDRDARLKQLRDPNPMKQYRGRDYHPWENQRIAY